MKAKWILVSLFVLLVVSCEKYADFTDDYDYTAVYFSYQNPVRTVFANKPEIKIGAMMAGKRENTREELVYFKIAPELLTNTALVGSKHFTLLPEDYYTLSSSNVMKINKGSFLGEVSLQLNADKFLNDPKATSNEYALPLLITGTSLDSIMNGEDGSLKKDYTIVVIKYIHANHGIYYHRGQRAKYDKTTNSLVDVYRYVTENQEQEFIQNIVWNMFTVDSKTLRCNGIGENITSNDGAYAMDITLAADGKVTLSNVSTSLIAIDEAAQDLAPSVYDADKKAFYLNYRYSDAQHTYVMKDTLLFRDDGLKLELW